MNQELIQDYEKQTGSSQYDPLTGLYNHAVSQILLSNELERYKRYGNSFGLLFVDIDWFSLLNKKHGPIEGDKILKSVSKRILENIRSIDSAARFSGDIFCVILPETVHSGALVAAERIQSAIANCRNSLVTASIGIAICPQDGQTIAELIEAGLNALKTAKIQGKNRIFIKDQPSTDPKDEKPTILVVDDDRMNQKLMKGILQRANFSIVTANNGIEALHACNKFNIDLVLLDIMMPELDGFQTCRRLKQQEHTRLIPVILLTALNDADSRLRGIKSGADDFITRPPNQMELIARTKSLISVKRLNKDLTSVENVLFSFAQAVEAKDHYTQGHIERVASLAVSIGREMKLTAIEIKALHFGGYLHDIGKIGVPHEILNKPGKLNPKEWEIMRSHPETGYKICMPLADSLGSALDTIRYHHEKLDGSGYPYGLKGDEIPIVARIMAIADIYDALITDRPYRDGMAPQVAIKIMHDEVQMGKLDEVTLQTLISIVG